MDFKICFLFISLLVATVTANTRDRNNKPYKVVCYWGTWAFYRPGDGKFAAEDIDPSLCTHLAYGFTKLQNNRIELYDPDLDIGDLDWNSGLQWGHGMIRRMMTLRDRNPNLSFLISIGGWNEGSDKYSQMARDPNARKIFVDSVLEFLQKYDFDGLDLDWEYPGMAAVGEADRKPGRDEDKRDFITLLKELHDALKPHGYLLTAAVSAGQPTIDRAYDIPELNKYLDFVNLMTYDFHGGWDTKTGHNAPLYAYPDAEELDKQFTVSYAVDYWLQKGLPSQKLVLGLALYGRTFTLASSTSFAMGSLASGNGGNAGPITRLVGMLGYNEICGMVKSGYQVHRDQIQKVPYAVNGNQWIGFDDVQSLRDKLDFLKSRNLGGAMVWTVDTDDFHGKCNMGKYPLLNEINRHLSNGQSNNVHVPDDNTNEQNNQEHFEPDQNDQQQDHNEPNHQDQQNNQQEPENQGNFVCKSNGYFKDPLSNKKFHHCVQLGDVMNDYVFDCAPGTKYEERHNACVLA